LVIQKDGRRYEERKKRWNEAWWSTRRWLDGRRYEEKKKGGTRHGWSTRRWLVIQKMEGDYERGGGRWKEA
jgi:hypothetical protein